MDNNYTINMLKEIIGKFCDDRDWSQFHNPKDLAIGISTEAGELLDLFRFKNEEQMNRIINGKKREQVADELADVLYFVIRFAQMNNIDLTTELKRKVALNELKYPIEKAKGKNDKYKDLK
ncbi:MAG: nucleotide pyrophosphohydrolase [Clostridia bacterium]|jgi:NTP pyrophosphatase (non-canonical NTP hydrolase)|nr:nucleotide pyrophosphohydrolase [Clostridia bacterium]